MTGEAIYMPDYIKDQCALAHTYAEDGAYGSAARVLEQLAKVVRTHAEQIFQSQVDMDDDK